MRQEIPMNLEEKQALHSLQNTLKEIATLKERAAQPNLKAHINQRTTKGDLLAVLGGCRLNGQRMDGSWGKDALIDAYIEIRITQRLRDLEADRDRLVTWFEHQGLCGEIQQFLAQTEGKEEHNDGKAART